MSEINENYYDYVNDHPLSKVVIYGGGYFSRKYYQLLGRIDYFCDKRADEIKSIGGISCIKPEEALKVDNAIVLVCIEKRSIYEEVRDYFMNNNSISIIYFFDNPAFSWFDVASYKREYSERKISINIVYKNDGWIFGKFANSLMREVSKQGYEVKISETEDINATINHYISNDGLREYVSNPNLIKTAMITHVDCKRKLDIIKYQAEHGTLGICMSKETMDKLASWGVPREKICYINPAHDNDMKPRKIILGITNRCYHDVDLRKRDDLILNVLKKLDSDRFILKIMGSGWDSIVEELRNIGVGVEYYNNFDREKYKELMSSLDYWIYYGFDEGAMGYLDAMAAGVKTIATPQGYHLDTDYGLTYECSTINEFEKTLKKIQDENKVIIDSVKDWTWENYAKKHIEVWNYLAGAKSLKELYKNQNEYMDGIFSVFPGEILI